jgi:hypothetical protein
MGSNRNTNRREHLCIFDIRAGYQAHTENIVAIA